MRILVLGDFEEDSPRFLLNNTRMFSKGFTRNGHDVLRFSYEQNVRRLSWLPSKSWSLRLFKQRTDELLWRLARHQEPELVFITAFKVLDAATVAGLRDAWPRATLVCWYGDHLRQVHERARAIAQHCHWFLATSAGAPLRDYHARANARCAFMPNPADKDVERPVAPAPSWRAKLAFIGKVKHKLPGQDPDREALIMHLVREEGMTIYGGMDRPRAEGRDYLNAISGADMVLSINAMNDVRLYHSDRLVRSAACGAFTLVKRVPDTELLFRDREHVCYFDSAEECCELIRRYENDPAARGRIAAAGRQHAHEEFACERLARCVVALVETGAYQAAWREVFA